MPLPRRWRTSKRPLARSLGALALLLLAAGCASGSKPARRATAPEAPAGRLRVVSYNVHLGEALIDERHGKSRSMARAFQDDEALRHADILGVQELCSDEGGWQVDYFDTLMGASGRPAYKAMALSDPIGKMMCGRVEAIFSRFPIVDSGAIELPNVRQPRSAVWADIDVPSADGAGTVRLRVYNAHLENRPVHMAWEEGRLRQTRAILRHLEAWRASHPGAPVLFLGDLNSVGRYWDFWRRESSIAELARHALAPSLPKFARTSTLTPHQIDWIFFHGLTLRGSKVVHVWLSDHFPVAADFELPTASQEGTGRGPSPPRD